MRVADTSALYALLDEADAHHAKAIQEVEDPEPIVVPPEILVETIDLVGYRFGHGAAQSALQDLLALSNIRRAEVVHLEAVVAVFLGAGGKLSLADAAVVQTCRALAARPLAFDRDILAACKQ